MPPYSRVPGYSYLKNPYLSNGMSVEFSDEFQELNNIRGLVPKGRVTEKKRRQRLMAILNSKSSDIDKYTFLHDIKDVSEKLYFSLIHENIEQLMPIIYTPTVGTACLKWSTLYNEQVKGLYISLDDISHVRECLDNWPNKNIKAIVMTDGERILGLGDLGSNGMGIPIGKLALYTACAGIPPESCLPIQIDAGCNNKNIINDPHYIGLRATRPTHGFQYYYDTLIKEIIESAQDKYGSRVLIQFEDFGNKNAFKLLEEYRTSSTCFNDDIQGTASVVLGGLLTSCRITKESLKKQTILLFGSGEAGLGIADLITSYLKIKTGCSIEEARENIWLFDSKGLIVTPRNVTGHKRLYAQNIAIPKYNTLEKAVEIIKPTVLIGTSGKQSTFTKKVIETMTNHTRRPIIMALSNPTHKAECTAKEAYAWSYNKAIFMSGSPFDPVICSDEKTRRTGQGNNAYVFPGIGLGALACGAKILEDDDFIVAAETLASCVSLDTLSTGSCYPPLNDIREISAKIACSVCKNQWRKNTASIPRPEWVLDDDFFLYRWIVDKMYSPM